MFSGERLKTLRIKTGLSQQNLADILKVSKSLISCYESGKRNPSLENIISFMEIFGVSSDYLLGADNLVKNKSNDKENYKILTNEELIFIEEIRKDKLAYEALLKEPKKHIEVIKKKLG